MMHTCVNYVVALYCCFLQYYIHHGGNRYVDLGLQTHKVKCRVHKEFKYDCILHVRVGLTN